MLKSITISTSKEMQIKSNNEYYIIAKMKRNEKGITLIALVVTIILLLILAAIAITLAVGNNGIITRTLLSVEENEKADLKEELELYITGEEINILGTGNKVTKEEIAKKLENLCEVNEYTDKEIKGEYKNYEFWVDENNNVTIGNKVIGDKPNGGTYIIKSNNQTKEVQIGVWGEIKSEKPIIEPLCEIEENTQQSTDTLKVYTVRENGEYNFRIKNSYNRSINVSCTVNYEALKENDIMSAIEGIEDSGIRNIEVTGKTNTDEQTTENYNFNIIKYKGNLILDGIKDIPGAIRNGTTYEFGVDSDIGTSNTFAQNTVVLKVQGDLTINSGVILTTKGGTYGGPKGLLVYCTGTLKNDGIISMTARGAKAIGQNVYLFKNVDGTYEYVPAIGGVGGQSVYISNTGTGGDAFVHGRTGNNGLNRQTRRRRLRRSIKL